MRIHLIAIGGAIMHNLAITLQKQGHIVTGSDDVIYDPARTRLRNHKLLPENEGWYPDMLRDDIDLVILGMHAKAENPELSRALELGLNIQSFPEFIANASHDKKRIVIGGSHGKTTTTSMIMHVLQYNNISMDYLVGAQLEDFDEMVRVSEADKIIIEGDEYLTSALDRKPKFLHYLPHIAVVTGIAWDHVNVFPDFNNYVRQFQLFIEGIEKGGTLIYDSTDRTLVELINGMDLEDIRLKPYEAIKTRRDNSDGTLTALIGNSYYEIKIFGSHNMKNMSAALEVCRELGVSDEDFAQAITTFLGAAKRFQHLGSNLNRNQDVYLDFAHAPSKVRASAEAISKQYSDRKVIVCMELHTYSSLSKNFLPHYQGVLEGIDEALVYYNPHAVKIKQLEEILPEDVYASFNFPSLVVSRKTTEVINFINEHWDDNTTLVFMSSANFGGIEYQRLATELLD